MKAVICTSYGAPEVLTLQEVAKPHPKDNEVLVKIKASAVNSGDVRVRGLVVTGFLRIVMRIVLGFTKPRKPILGNALSGVVETVGNKVTKFKPGDEIFAATGFKFGAYAQYIALPQNGTITHKPQTASFNQAAAIIFGGMTAIYFLKKAGIDAKPNQQVLIYGATGSVGTAAIEIAKHYQAHITAVCGEQGVELATKLGSHEVVVYTKQDFTKLNRRFDLIFDAVGAITHKDCAPILKHGSKFVTVGGLDVAKETTQQLEMLQQLYDNGEIHANIDRTYPMEEVVAAHQYVDTGRKKGNVVLQID